jgi:hypothetical protein
MRRLLFASLLVSLALFPAAPAAAKAKPVYRGKLEVRHSDDFRHDRGQTSWTLRTRSRSIPLRPLSVPRARSGERVVVRGRKQGGWLEGTVRRRAGATAHAAAALGPHSVAVVLLNFTSDTREPWTPAYVNQRIFTDSDSTAAFYSEESHGAITLSGDVYGWYTIDAATAGCDVDLWASQARAAASAAGVDLSAYDHVQFVFPQQASCNWAGLGELPGSQTWLNGDISVRVAAHELGHNMGLHHANSYSCTANGAPATMGPTCSSSEYGDPFDVMGSYAHHNNAWHLQQLGVVGGANVQTATASGTYTLSSSISGTGTELLRVPAGPNYFYDLEIRASGGVFDSFSSTAPVVNGVSIHYDRPTSWITQSQLLDATPGTSTFGDSPLPSGSTFSDGSVSITASSVSAGSATVDVVLGPAADVTAPSAPGGFNATTAPGSVTLSWTAATDDVGVAGYRVYRDDTLVASTPQLSYTDGGAVQGMPHKYQVTAYDAAGNSRPSTVLWVTPPPVAGTAPSPPPDTQAPRVHIISPGHRVRARRQGTRVAASALDDRGVARMEMRIDGVRVASSDRAAISRTWFARRVRPGVHVVRVTAVDSSGNVGSSVRRVRVLGSVRGSRQR